MKLFWKVQHFTCIFATNSPFDQASIFFESVNVSDPVCARGTCYDHYIRHVTGADAAADCELHSFQQTSLAPLILKPLDRNLR